MSIFKIPYRNLLLCSSSVFLVGLTSTPVRGFTLDLFNEANDNSVEPFPGFVLNDEGQRVEVNTSTGVFVPSENTDTSLTSVTGERRHLKISANSTEEATLEVKTASSELVLGTESNAISTGLVVWNGSDNIDYNDLTTDASLTGVDLEATSGHDSIAIEITFADLGGTLDFTLYDGTNTHTVSQSIPTVGTSDPAETLYYNFSIYEDNSVNINDVKYISMGLTGPAASDIRLNFVETAIEPTAVPFEFSPSLGIILCSSIFGLNILSQQLKNRNCPMVKLSN